MTKRDTLLLPPEVSFVLHFDKRCWFLSEGRYGWVDHSRMDHELEKTIHALRPSSRPLQHARIMEYGAEEGQPLISMAPAVQRERVEQLLDEPFEMTLFPIIPKESAHPKLVLFNDIAVLAPPQTPRSSWERCVSHRVELWLLRALSRANRFSLAITNGLEDQEWAAVEQAAMQYRDKNKAIVFRRDGAWFSDETPCPLAYPNPDTLHTVPLAIPFFGQLKHISVKRSGRLFQASGEIVPNYSIIEDTFLPVWLREHVYGSGASRDIALVKCIGEAVERSASITGPEGFMVSHEEAISMAKSLGLPLSTLPLPGRSHPCLNTRFMATGEPGPPIPRDYVTMFVAVPPEQRIWHTSSSGSAAGPTEAFAAQRAVIELCERDAVATTWITQRAPLGIPLRFLPARLAAMAEETARRHGGIVRILNASGDLPIARVLAIFVRDHAPPFAVRLTAGAAFSFEAALSSALEELALVVDGNELSADSLQRQAELESNAVLRHIAHYSRSDTLEAIRFLITSPDSILRPKDYPELTYQNLATVIERTTGYPVLWIKLFEEEGWVAGRAVAPGLLPIWFGTLPFPLVATKRASQVARQWNVDLPDYPERLPLHPFA